MLMSNKNMQIDFEKIVKHLMDTSDEDFKTATILFEAKVYAWALFLGHISVEKLIKAYYANKFRKHAPFTHNLYRLAELSEIKLTDKYSDWLDKITSFNLNARYDDYKRDFYSLCTVEYAREWIEKIKEVRTWIKQMF
jgi:HEPN domain-containing protein